MMMMNHGRVVSIVQMHTVNFEYRKIFHPSTVFYATNAVFQIIQLVVLNQAEEPYWDSIWALNPAKLQMRWQMSMN